MKKELKELLQRLLESIIANGKAGVSNAIMDVDVDDAEYEFDYLLKALTELKNLENGEEVDFKNVKDAIGCCMRDARCTKQNVKNIIEWYNHSDDCSGEYHPSDELVDELVELIKK